MWGTAHSTFRAQFPDDVDLPPEGGDRLVPRGYVGSRGPVNVGWQLTEALRKYGGYERDVTVHPFYYDWRLSSRDNARKLAQFVATVSRGRKVDIVSHSAGSLVALAYVKLLGGGSAVENLVMIAPARRGVVDAFRVFVRPERFFRREFTPSIVATWPFVTELLPEDGRILVDASGAPLPFDAWDAASWKAIIPEERQTAFAASLSGAKRFREELTSAPMPGSVRVSVIAGDCVPTARRVLRRADGSYVFYQNELGETERHLAPLLFEPGDGTVPVSSTRVDEEPLIFCDGHQGLATDPNVHRALVRALRER